MTVTAAGALRQCPRCGWWTHVLEAGGACLDCTLGWVHCPAHTCRLEWAGPGHRKVTAHQVVATMRGYAKAVLATSAGPRGARAKP